MSILPCPFLLLVWNFLTMLLAKDGEISEKMCRKYAEAVYVSEEDLGSSSTSEYHNVSKCGIVSVPLIIGGTEAHDEEFPHFARVGFGPDPDAEMKWYCGGSLISENFVLTAAHCTHSTDIGPAQKVMLGVISADIGEQDPDAVQTEIIKKIVKHPNYKPPHKYHDIALLKLRNKIEFSPAVRPACLNTQYALKENNGIAIGFGLTTQDAEDISSSLMKVTLPFVNRSVCGEYYPPRALMEQGLVSSMLCAGALEGGKDTCQGDSGGPLQVILEKPYCMYSVVGITSFGSFCGYANSPAIYTNISHYIGWIENIVWKQK